MMRETAPPLFALLLAGGEGKQGGAGRGPRRSGGYGRRFARAKRTRGFGGGVIATGAAEEGRIEADTSSVRSLCRRAVQMTNGAAGISRARLRSLYVSQSGTNDERSGWGGRREADAQSSRELWCNRPALTGGAASPHMAHKSPGVPGVCLRLSSEKEALSVQGVSGAAGAERMAGCRSNASGRSTSGTSRCNSEQGSLAACSGGKRAVGGSKASPQPAQSDRK